ncbi:hypothetical protein TSUD_99750 [Trifolium subterraneum]|uniref:Uncharacterized protein n=1 Tax=Trifolium subterraneum TaxID=3900 RepID=A0A2Z6P963_TRISU|nr:hypothetical protein TSUD_99750 [Trifolium subterraneum]
MKLTESSENNADAGNDFPLKSDDHNSLPVELHDHVKELNHTVIEDSLKENIQDEKVLGLNLENGGKLVEVTPESVVTDAESVCKSPDGGLSSTDSGWPAFNTKPCSYPYSLVGNEEAIVAVLHLQHNAIDACQKFLAPDGSDSDEDVIEDEDEDDDESEDELVESCDEESKEYRFFEKVFAEDVDLRKYYENNSKEGDFYCLVCGGIKKKMWKRFKDCVALIQHSTTVLRTKRMRAHRAYAQVVCKVVGWDINQLPTIALKDVDSSLAASKKLLVEPEKPAAANGVDDQNVTTHESVVSDAEWVCKSPNGRLSSTASEWPAFNTKPCSYPYSLVGDEEAIVAVLHLQHNAIDACQKFLAPDDGSDSDEDVIEDEDEDESDDESVENCDEESEEYKFFKKVFAEDDGLRKYYENNSKKGDFYCLVCGGIKKKMWKRFKDCVALVQHSTAVLRTKRKRAHRAYAQVVCKLVGWDINQLPAIVVKDLDSSLATSKKLLVEPEKPAAVGGVDDKNGELVNSVDDN